MRQHVDIFRASTGKSKSLETAKREGRVVAQLVNGATQQSNIFFNILLYGDSVARLRHHQITCSLTKYFIEQAFDYLTVV